MRLPLLAFQLAKDTHAPNAVGIFELGLVRASPAPAPLLTMGDLPNLYHALSCTDMLDVMGLLQQGRVDLGFIGGAEIDRFGNLNTSYIGHPARPQVRLPGSGGACDIASLARRLIIIMSHERRRFVERVSYITSPGYGDGGDWRQRVGLRGGGPTAVITTLGVLRFREDTREMFLDSYHPGVSVEAIKANTGWDLLIAENVHETSAPTPHELEILRKYDTQGFWTR
jgi:glutaconate CoA-transferase subunit B